MPYTYVWNVITKDTDGYAKTAQRPTSAGRKCFYRFVIHHGWESADIAEAIFIRINSFQIQRRYNDNNKAVFYKTALYNT